MAHSQREQEEDELRDYERLCQSSQAMIFYAVMSRLMPRRLACA
jgi:hypothetical protein